MEARLERAREATPRATGPVARLRWRLSGDVPPRTGIWVVWGLVAAGFLIARALSGLFSDSAAAGFRMPAFIAVGEMWLFAGILIWLAQRSAVRTLAASLNVPRRLVLAGIAALLVIGQYGMPSGSIYPFTTWGMYAHEGATRQYSQYLLVTPAGERAHLSFSGATPVTSPRAFMSRLDQLVARSVAGDETATEALEVLLSRLALDADDGARTVEVSTCRFSGIGADEPVRCSQTMVVRVTDQGEATGATR